jgi:lactate dehydrogenase-like 2-hydroxyacid dehydrogenase
MENVDAVFPVDAEAARAERRTGQVWRLAAYLTDDVAEQALLTVLAFQRQNPERWLRVWRSRATARGIALPAPSLGLSDAFGWPGGTGALEGDWPGEGHSGETLHGG